MARNPTGRIRPSQTKTACFAQLGVFRCSWMVVGLTLLARRTSFSLGFVPLYRKPTANLLSLVSKMESSSSRPSIPKMLEVEQKFTFSDRPRLELGLREIGFETVKEITMVDWYFDRFVESDDASKNDVEMPLVRRDHWLRYRETGNSGEGEWQLKRGNKSSGDGLTVYEEVEGSQALEIVKSVLRQQQPDYTHTDISSTLPTFDGYPIPILPVSDCDVAPFARIVTHRAKWKQQQGLSEDLSNLVVDLDTTPDGFAIGEVELVVEGENSSIDFTGSKEAAAQAQARNDRAVAMAQEKIREFLAGLLDEEREKGRSPMGKLERFLSQNRPQIYKTCVESGVIPKR